MWKGKGGRRRRGWRGLRKLLLWVVPFCRLNLVRLFVPLLLLIMLLRQCVLCGLQLRLYCRRRRQVLVRLQSVLCLSKTSAQPRNKSTHWLVCLSHSRQTNQPARQACRAFRRGSAIYTPIARASRPQASASECDAGDHCVAANSSGSPLPFTPIPYCRLQIFGSVCYFCVCVARLRARPSGLRSVVW